jgi:AcrR family transcriptional regulator
MAPRTNPDARPGQLIEAAKKVFAQKGVVAATVSDITEAAGTAKGTFYLYFPSKEHLIDAVAEQMTTEMVDAAEKALSVTGPGPIERLVMLLEAMIDLAETPTGREMIERYHKPENRAIHDRMAGQIIARLVPIVRDIIEQGIAEKLFNVADPDLAALFVLGGLHALELASGGPSSTPSALTRAFPFVLRTLGYTGDLPRLPTKA